MAPQLATVDVALNAFYGYPMLSPTTRSQKTSFDSIARANEHRLFTGAIPLLLSARTFLPAAFPPWAGTFFIIEPGTSLIPTP